MRFLTIRRASSPGAAGERVVVVTTSYPAGPDDPSGHFVQADVRGLERAGARVTVLSPRPGGAFGWPGIAARVRARPWWLWEVAAWAREAEKALENERFDRIVAHWAVPCAWPVTQRFTGPLAVVSHGGDVRALLALPAGVRGRIVGAIADRATEWRFVAEGLHARFFAGLGAEARAKVGRIAKVGASAIEVDVLAAAKARARVLAASIGGERFASVVGRLVPGKRVGAIIDAVARPARGGDEQLPRVLVVVGDGPERGRLERRARWRGVDARFVGAVDRSEALGWMAASDRLFFAARDPDEGAPTVLREADALGVPVHRIYGSVL